MGGHSKPDLAVQQALVAAIDAVGTEQHVGRLADFIAALVPHDLVTVVRYSVTERPEFVSHRNYSDEMVKRYLEAYYPYDPFYRQWRDYQAPGVVRLLAAAPVPYVSEFLVQSVITDELGVLLDDGWGWCLGIFLDRRRRRFSGSDVARLEKQFPAIAALHALDTRTRVLPFRLPKQQPAKGFLPRQYSAPADVDRLWADLSPREREVVQLILAGHTTDSIAGKLGLARGTVKNHRRNIYDKLDITTERELFLQLLDSTGGPR